MYCTKCGAVADDNAVVCPNCGQPLNAAQPQQQVYQPTVQPAQPQPSILPWGILSLVFSGVLGLIFAIIGRNKAKNYPGTLTGAAKVGAILSKVGLILNIVALVVYAIVIIAVIAGGNSLSGLSGLY